MAWLEYTTCQAEGIIDTHRQKTENLSQMPLVPTIIEEAETPEAGGKGEVTTLSEVSNVTIKETTQEKGL